MNLEDFEFSTRFLMQGKKTQYASDALVYQEAIAKARPFIRYRSGGCSGYGTNRTDLLWLQAGSGCHRRSCSLLWLLWL